MRCLYDPSRLHCFRCAFLIAVALDAVIFVAVLAFAVYIVMHQ